MPGRRSSGIPRLARRVHLIRLPWFSLSALWRGCVRRVLGTGFRSLASLPPGDRARRRSPHPARYRAARVGTLLCLRPALAAQGDPARRRHHPRFTTRRAASPRRTTRLRPAGGTGNDWDWVAIGVLPNQDRPCSRHRCRLHRHLHRAAGGCSCRPAPVRSAALCFVCPAGLCPPSSVPQAAR